MIFYVRSSSVEHDYRLRKYLSANLERNKKYSVIQWNRSGSSMNEEGIVSFPLQAKHGQRYLNLWKILLWNFFIIKALFVNRKNIVSVHAIDFDTIMPAFLFCKIFGKKCIFDIYDKYTDSRSISGNIGRLIDKFERFFIRNSDVAILADESRIEQHALKNRPNHLMIIENVPEVDKGSCETKLTSKTKIKIGYVGGLEALNRGLEDVANYVSQSSEHEFHVAGFGDLEDFFFSMSEDNPNINYIGPCKHEDGMALLKECDIVLGMYYLNVANHRFAAPNKYYEHLMLGKPLLTTEGTPPGAKVSFNMTGWAIKDNYESLNRFFEQELKKESLKILGNNAKKLWESRYRNYYKEMIVGNYIDKAHGRT